VLNGGGAFELEMFDWNGTSGTGWDLLAIDGNLSLSNSSASPFTINLVSMSSTNASGLSSNWNAGQSFTNTFLTYSGNLAGSFDSSAFFINTNSFQNASDGVFSVISVGGGLALRYTANGPPAPVTGFVWNAGSGLLSAAGAWANGSAPTNGSSIAIGGGSGGVITNDALGTLAGIVFTNGAGSFGITGNSLTLGSGGVTNLSTAAQTFSNNLVLGAPVTLAAAAGDLAVAGSIDNNGNLLTIDGGANTALGGVVSNAGGLTKNGDGRLTLAANNIFSGALNMNGGTLVLQGSLAATAINIGSGVLQTSATGLLSDDAALTVSNTGTLDLGGFSDAVGSLLLTNNGSVTGSGTLSATTYTLGGGTVSANLGAGTVVVAGGTNTINGNVAGSLAANSGTANVNGLVAGNLNVGGGIVNLGAANRVADNASVSVSGGALNLGGHDTVGTVQITGGAVGGSGALTAGSYDIQSGTVSAALAGAGALTKSGGGTAVLGGNNSSYSGTIDVQAGTLVAAHNNALGANAVVLTNGGIRAASGVSVANNFTIGQPTSGTTNFVTNAFTAYWNFGTNVGSGVATSSAGEGISFSSVANGNSLAAVFLTNNSVSSGYSGASGQFNAGANARGGVWSNGSTHFSFSLTGSNGYTVSLTNVSFGSRSTATGPSTLALFSSLDGYAVALASNSVSTNGSWVLVAPSLSATALAEGTVGFRIYGFGGAGGSSSANWRLDDLSLSGITVTTSTTVGAAIGSGSLGIHEAGTATFNGAITNHTAATLHAVEGGHATFAGIISGAGLVSKTGTGTVTLSGANLHTGDTMLQEGVLRLASAGAAGRGVVRQMDGSSRLEIETLADITNGMSVHHVAFLRSGSLSGSLRLNNATFFVTNGETSTLSGVLTSEEGGQGGVTKTGDGRLLLSGNNTYIGPTDVQAGILELATVGGSAAGATESVSVGSGATLLISQSDQVNNGATVTLSGGTIQRASGVSEAFGNLNVITASVLDFSGGSGGTLEFSGLHADYTPSSFKALQLLNFTQGNTLVIRNTQDWATEINSGFTFGGTGGFGSSSFSDGTFTITAIPEPSTYLAAAGLLSLMLWPSRKRLLKDAKKILGFAPPMRDRLARRASES
jgi:fibronectin-binding autotransporter adhesin